VFGGALCVAPVSGQANAQSNNYWSATEYAPNTNNAWNFNFNNGNQNNNNKTNGLYGWAVHAGE
jgi:Flp pilus assembly protein TadG